MNIPIYCILYKQDFARVDNVYNNIKPVLRNVNIIPAINGETNELEYHLGQRTISEKFLKFCRRGQLACLLSHIKVWNLMIDNNVEEAIILEDDAVISDNFYNEFELIYNELPKDYDLLYLFIHPDSEKNITNDTKYTYINENTVTYGTVGYVLTLKMAKEFITFFNTNISTTVDSSIMWYLKNKKSKYFGVKESIVFTGGSLYFHSVKDTDKLGSIISKSQIYEKSNAKPEFYIDSGNYWFYPCCDSEFNDIDYINNMSIDELKDKYLNDTKVVGFNGYGWIKDKIVSRDSWKVYKQVNFDGLYIKKYLNVSTNAILLTGGCGYIGSHCAVELISEGYDLIIVDDLSNSSMDVIEKIKDISRLNNLNPNINFYNCDLKNKAQISQIFNNHPNIISVFHFAAYKAVNESVKDPLKYYNNNIMSLINLLECMKTYNINKIIFSSSATVYGNPEELPLTEKSRLNTLNPYGRTKLFSEEILKDVSDAYNIKVICLRYFNPVGAHTSGLIGENPNGKPNNLFPYILSVIKGKIDYLSVFGDDYDTVDGTGVRDYIHVMDLAKGHIAALKYLDNTEKLYDMFNLGTGKGYSVLQIVNSFRKILDKEVPYKIVKRREGDAATVYADCSKSKDVLKWETQYELDDMVRDCMNFNYLN